MSRETAKTLAEERHGVYSNVVVAVDGSDEARNAARHGVGLARRFDATVHAVHVLDRRTLRVGTGGADDRLRRRAETVLSDATALASDHGVAVESVLEEGVPARAVVDVADEVGADLIVAGQRGSRGVADRLLGSVTEGVLAGSDVPVLVVPGATPDATGDAAPDYDRLLLPTDGSDHALTAASHAASLARRVGASTDVLHVVDLQAAGGLFDAGGIEQSLVERLEAEGQTAVEETVAAVREADPASVDGRLALESAVVRESSFDGPAAGIGTYVADHGVDLVVIGSRGRSTLGRTLLGSVASRVVRTVDVPVLVVTRPG